MKRFFVALVIVAWGLVPVFGGQGSDVFSPFSDPADGSGTQTGYEQFSGKGDAVLRDEASVAALDSSAAKPSLWDELGWSAPVGGASNLRLLFDRRGPADYFQQRPDIFAGQENPALGRVVFSSASVQAPSDEEQDSNLRLGLYFNFAPARHMTVYAGADYFFPSCDYSGAETLLPVSSRRGDREIDSSGQDENWGSSVVVSLDF